MMTDNNINIESKLTYYINEVDRLGNFSHEVLKQIEVILTTIKEKSSEYSDIHRLAMAGEYLAMDHANSIDCHREQLISDIKEGLAHE